MACVHGAGWAQPLVVEVDGGGEELLHRLHPAVAGRGGDCSAAAGKPQRWHRPERETAVGRGELVVLAAALPDCEAAGVVCHRRHSNGNRDGPQLPNGRSDESEGDQDNVAQLEGAVANGTAEGSSAGESDAGVLRVSRFFAEEHHLASGDRVQLKPLAKQALTLNRAVLVARTQRAYRFATKREKLWRNRLWEAGAGLPVAVRGSVLRVRSEISLADKSARKGKGKKGKGKAKLETDEGEDEERDQSESDDDDEDDGVDGSAGPTWEEYTIADTRPLLQGVLDATRTLIVILPPTAKKTTPSVAASAPLPSFRPDAQHVDNSSAAQQRPKRSPESPLLLSSFILPSCRSLLSSNVSSAELDRSSSDDLKPAVLETSFLSRPLTTLEPGAACLGSNLLLLSAPSWRDEMTEVGLSLFTLRQLHLFSGSTVVLSSAESNRERLARAYALPSGQEWANERLYLSPILAYNLGITHGESVTVREHCAGWTEARAVHISLVRSPAASLAADYAGPLRRFFRSPRLLALGDLIPVVLPPPRYPFLTHKGGDANDDEDHDADEDDDDEEEDETSGDHDNREGGVVYFKVTRVLPEGTASFFRVSQEETTLVQEGVVNSAFPPLASSYLLPDDKDPEAQQGEGWEEVEDVMQACLEGPAVNMDLGCSIVVYGPPANGKFTLARYLSTKLGIHLVTVDLYDLARDGPLSEVVSGLTKAFREAWACHPSLLLIRSLHALRSSGPSHTDVAGSVAKELAALANEYCDGKGGKVALLGTAEQIDDIPAPIRAIFRHEINLPTPGVEVRLRQLTRLFARTPLAPDVELPDVARKTASFVGRELRSLHAHAAATALARADSRWEAQRREAVCAAGVVVTAEDIEAGIDKVSSHRASNISAPNIPNIQWEDVGGLAHVKREILDTIQLPLNRPDLFSGDLRKRSGLLLYGPPGTGKTLVAKAVATECSLNFMSVKGPELINMYIGESEKNVRDTFQRARDARPCVIFFDELDSLAPARGAGADSGGVMDRIVSQLLTELDGIHKSADVFVIGATNRPDLLEPALLRPGRFDRLLYLGVPEDHAQQLHIVKALTRKFRLAPSVRLEEVVQACPLNLTGADFYAVCSEALQSAIRERILLSSSASTEASSSTGTSTSTSASSSLPSPGDEVTTTGPVSVEQRHFMEALRSVTPSVSPTELLRYRELQQTYAQGRPAH
ncbi:Peroxin 6 (Pex6), putative [Acanthamoeba castellanii str. Neff]|uniref:Peroxisomal ATPase PEX6 n=1 Tax=Acanthamoeba castellanii (strain ATCC 30010 / Neff) TaxID=1257118 RepID=L8HFS5_ACACF|nr:Peroxin 6 (Pex6), putative [Acanthamoeba castellanii str. Neff]ELR23296.1 Proteasome ATPase, putative [Acanthamoeba castellanii str. Neff]